MPANYASGGTLLTKINAGGYSTDEAYGWLTDVARGMDHLHQRKMVVGQALCHQDLKLENILIATDGFISGSSTLQPDSARSLLPTGQKTLRHAVTTGQTGTNRYMAPENWCATAYGKSFNAKVDVFSFAILAWELLSKKCAYENLFLTGEMLAEGVTISGLRPPLPPKWPVELKQLLGECWAEDSSRRPEFAEIAQRFAAQHAATLGPPPQPRQPQRSSSNLVPIKVWFSSRRSSSSRSSSS
ncbi:kinase-like domain-containing protein [Pavlovales sp. CCMP2436]|nr:kinase-like domain-containing protein [Pavlovales sp. CCMP2436]